MKHNDSYAKLVNEFMSKLEDTIGMVSPDNTSALDNLRELRDMADKISFRADSIEVYSLNYFFKYIDELIADGQLEKYAACRFDMKRFSVVNHQFGRETGTKILKEFIERLQKTGASAVYKGTPLRCCSGRSESRM